MLFRSVGYLCCTLGDGADFEVTGDAGWSIGADMHAGSVLVHGGAGTNTGASMKGGTVTVKGSVGTRAAIANKGGTVVIGGDAGYMSGFMFQKGVLVVCGDVDDGIGDSMYAGDMSVATASTLARAARRRCQNGSRASAPLPSPA